jgi:hypothetical protein
MDINLFLTLLRNIKYKILSIIIQFSKNKKRIKSTLSHMKNNLLT